LSQFRHGILPNGRMWQDSRSRIPPQNPAKWRDVAGFFFRRLLG
jgi:hypothetical protein